MKEFSKKEIKLLADFGPGWTLLKEGEYFRGAATTTEALREERRSGFCMVEKRISVNEVVDNLICLKTGLLIFKEWESERTFGEKYE